ncbi:Mu transposase C-terminal domain-containing protein [Kitasatospora sp. NPDC059408]|uniref:Mu transposase C-terminal domain-containing protein n=1 Tax=Kitasatospora sp. NPDC059408 TaxID=3346823 RepID=UPI00367B0EF7
MTPATRGPFRLHCGARLWLDGRPHTVTGITDDTVRLRSDTGALTLIGAGALLAEPTFRPYGQAPDGTAPEEGRPDAGALLDRLSPQQWRELLRAQEHLLELTTGYRSGCPDDSRPDEPRAQYAPGLSLTRRVESKAAELGYAPVQMWRRLKRWREEGLWGLVDRRSLRRSGPAGPAGAPAKPDRAEPPEIPGLPLVADRPGAVVLVDTVPLDVSAVDPATGAVTPVGLTAAVDLCTRSLLGWRLLPGGAGPVDAGLVIADALVPEPMRPGWPDDLRHRTLRLPCEPLLAADERFAAAAARPVVFPERIVVDRGAAVVPETVKDVCRRYGIVVQGGRAYPPAGKPQAVAALAHVRAQFAAHLAGRGEEPDRPRTTGELEELFAEYAVAGYQRRRQPGLALPGLPGPDLSPNEAYRLAVHRCGYIAAPRDPALFLELLPIHWAVIRPDGVHKDGLRYDGRALRRHVGRPSPYPGGRWPIRYDPRDPGRVHFHDPGTGTWSALARTSGPGGVEPFADLTPALREVLAHRGARTGAVPAQRGPLSRERAAEPAGGLPGEQAAVPRSANE